MTHRLWLALCIALSLILGEFISTQPAPVLASGPPTVATLHLALLNAPSTMVGGQTGLMTAALDQPVNDGSITFTETYSASSPGQPVAVYACTPVHGSCTMTWSAPPGYGGSVTIGAVWSGDARFKPVSVTRPVLVIHAPYTYTGTWHGVQLAPLTRLVPAPTSLLGARKIGQILSFRTLDPAYACMDGRPSDVFVTNQFPDEYLVYHAGTGPQCPAGAWLFAQTPTLSGATPAAARTGTRITLHGSFPAARPYDATVQFLGVQERGVPVTSWSLAAVDAIVPSDLLTGRYALSLTWHDHLIGAAVRSSGTPVPLQVTGRSLPPAPAANTKVLDQQTLNDLTPPPNGQPSMPRASANSGPGDGVLKFHGTTPFLQSLKVGDIVAAGVSSATPDGMLRKVTAVGREGAGFSVTTAPATLHDAVKQGSFDVQKVLTQGDIQSFTPLQRGVTMAPQDQSNNGPCFPINNVKLYDSGSGNTVVANGKLCLSASLDFAGYLDWHGAGASFTATASDTAHLQLVAANAVSFDKSINLFTLNLTPISFAIGPVPVVIVPQLTFSVGANGKISASVSVGVTQTATFSTGAGCDIVWFSSFSCAGQPPSISNTFTPDPVLLKGQAQISGYAALDFKAMLYGVVGADLGVRGYVEADASTSADPWWSLYAGVKLTIGFDLNLFGIQNHSDFTLADWKDVIAHAPGGLEPAVDLSVSPTSVACGYQQPDVITCGKFGLTANVANPLGPVGAKVTVYATMNGGTTAIGTCTTDASTGVCNAQWTPPNPGADTAAQITASIAGATSATVSVTIHGTPLVHPAVNLSVNPTSVTCSWQQQNVITCGTLGLTATVTTQMGSVSVPVTFSASINGNASVVASCATDPSTGTCTASWTPDNPGADASAQITASISEAISSPVSVTIHGRSSQLSHLQVSVTPHPIPLRQAATITIAALDADSSAHEAVAGTATIHNYDANGNKVDLLIPTNTPVTVTLHDKVVRWKECDPPDPGSKPHCWWNTEHYYPTGTVSAPGFMDQSIDFGFPPSDN